MALNCVELKKSHTSIFFSIGAAVNFPSSISRYLWWLDPCQLIIYDETPALNAYLMSRLSFCLSSFGALYHGHQHQPHHMWDARLPVNAVFVPVISPPILDSILCYAGLYRVCIVPVTPQVSKCHHWRKITRLRWNLQLKIGRLRWITTPLLAMSAYCTHVPDTVAYRLNRSLFVPRHISATTVCSSRSRGE